MAAKYVPLNDLDIAAIKNARDTHLHNAALGDHQAYRDCIRLDDIIDAHTVLEPMDVQQWAQQRLADLRAVAQEFAA